MKKRTLIMAIILFASTQISPYLTQLLKPLINWNNASVCLFLQVLILCIASEVLPEFEKKEK